MFIIPYDKYGNWFPYYGRLRYRNNHRGYGDRSFQNYSSPYEHPQFEEIPQYYRDSKIVPIPLPINPNINRIDVPNSNWQQALNKINSGHPVEGGANVIDPDFEKNRALQRVLIDEQLRIQGYETNEGHDVVPPQPEDLESKVSLQLDNFNAVSRSLMLNPLTKTYQMMTPEEYSNALIMSGQSPESSNVSYNPMQYSSPPPGYNPYPNQEMFMPMPGYHPEYFAGIAIKIPEGFNIDTTATNSSWTSGTVIGKTAYMRYVIVYNKNPGFFRTITARMKMVPFMNMFLNTAGDSFFRSFTMFYAIKPNIQYDSDPIRNEIFDPYFPNGQGLTIYMNNVNGYGTDIAYFNSPNDKGWGEGFSGHFVKGTESWGSAKSLNEEATKPQKLDTQKIASMGTLTLGNEIAKAIANAISKSSKSKKSFWRR